MTDRYLSAVNAGLVKTLATKLGLPRPAVLRRYQPGDPLLPGPALVIAPEESQATADELTAALRDWGVEVQVAVPSPIEAVVTEQTPPPPKAAPTPRAPRWGAIIVVLTEVTDPTDLAAPAMALSANLRQLKLSGRVVTLSQAPTAADSPAVAATREGIDGFVRSVAKELRAGSTGNAIMLTDGARAGGVSTRAALRFLLSGKSAFVDGQPIHVGPDAPGAELSETDRPLAGKCAVVTGAARGIGAQVARILARDGAHVVVVDVPASGEALTRIANEVHGTALQLDVTTPDAGERIAAHCRDRHGGLHILVQNAGILRDKLLVNMPAASWEAVIAVNLAAQVRMTAAILAADGFAESPRVVSLASTSGIAGNRGQSNYAFSKAGVIGHTRAIAPLLAEIGGTANAVAPGFIETEMTASIPLVAREMARRVSSLQQGGQPVDVAEAIAFLAAPDAGGINGQVVRVCGQHLVGQ